ncbi:MAG: alpha/beta fold hydrolase [Pseudomonadota bacterium]
MSGAKQGSPADHDDASSAKLLLPALEVETAAQPQRSVIWLHGLGADGHDFEAIVPAFNFDRTRVPAIRFIFPHAPMRPVTVNGGYVMRAWYDILSPDFAQRREDAHGVHTSARQIEALIAREQARGIAAKHIVLAGFSQGGAIALHTALRYPQRLAGVLALSTYLPLADTLLAEAHKTNHGLPIFMAHGQHDPVIPYPFAQNSATFLSAAGYPVDWHAYAAEHTLIQEEVRDIEAWLQQVLAY